ncbi:TetR/AcrR family transcriptional regulator [Streptomyces sp. NBC_01304]|uniref:TetR/AcrR family transcriptional regulator n=1 Tax=Streptomyces sp. NBC_01304 TaxID=2903818 RepID=UPI002E0E07AB|nr:TetR family transcriptional regulator [Streptomyces sp. NBC_01304]
MDGRKERGLRSRRLLVEAALRVVAQDGVGGVTHRAVAKEAGLPPASGTYHFKSIDDLLVAALTSSAEEYAEQLRGELDGADSTADVARRMLRDLYEDRAHTIACYELTLLAARRPALRPAARKWTDLIASVGAGLTGDPLAVKSFTAATDGLLLHALIADEPPSEGELTDVLNHVLHKNKAHGNDEAHEAHENNEAHKSKARKT